MSVTNPTPGSCTSRARTWLASTLICSPSRSVRDALTLRNSTSLRVHEPGLDPLDLVEHAPAARGSASASDRGDGHDAETRPLPEVLVLDFRHRHVEAAKPVLHAPQHHPLVLQRMRAGDEQLERQQSHDHLRHAPCHALALGSERRTSGPSRLRRHALTAATFSSVKHLDDVADPDVVEAVEARCRTRSPT